MASIKQNKDPNSPRYNFETAVADLLPVCPVACKKRKNPDKASKIAGLEASIGLTETTTKGDISAFGGKVGHGPKTRVHLRYHTKKKYKGLNKAQCQALYKWRQTEGQWT